ncbi:hypothetical protein [Haloferula helveola]
MDPFPSLLAASRNELVLWHLILALGIGLLVGGFAMLMIILGIRKKGGAMNGAAWQKAALYGVCGLVAGYFSMKFTIKANPTVFGGSRPGVPEQYQLPPQPKPKIPPRVVESPGTKSKPPASMDDASRRLREMTDSIAKDRDEAEREMNEAFADHERQQQEMAENREREADQAREAREERLRRAEDMRKERDARREQAKAEQERARADEAAAQDKDKAYLATLSLEELEQVRDERQAAVDRAKEGMRSEDRDVRMAAGKEFSKAVKAFMAASAAYSQKRRESR